MFVEEPYRLPMLNLVRDRLLDRSNEEAIAYLAEKGLGVAHRGIFVRFKSRNQHDRPILVKRSITTPARQLPSISLSADPFWMLLLDNHARPPLSDGRAPYVPPEAYCVNALTTDFTLLDGMAKPIPSTSVPLDLALTRPTNSP